MRHGQFVEEVSNMRPAAKCVMRAHKRYVYGAGLHRTEGNGILALRSPKALGM